MADLLSILMTVSLCLAVFYFGKAIFVALFGKKVDKKDKEN